MKKSVFVMLSYCWSAEYVIAHAIWQKSRGRMPSMPYRGVRNPKKALALAKIMIKDTQFNDVVIRKADKGSITREDGLSFCIQDEWEVNPKPGDIARFYGRGFGSIVRGLDINGVQCFYRTEEQQNAENARQRAAYEAKQKANFEKNKASLDEKYQNLPKVFQMRIDKFRKNNPDFRWKYESYEMFCCEQAFVIATTISKRLLDETKTKWLSVKEAKKIIYKRAPTAIQNFYEMPWENQRETVPDIADGHSGNTFGCSVRLASFYISKHPKNIVKLHGALAPLVGSKEYGCVARA